MFCHPTDTGSCQQVLRSGSRQCAHGLRWRHPRWRVTRVSYPSCRGAGRGLSGRDHGCVAHCGWCPQGRCQTRSLMRDGRALTPLADSHNSVGSIAPGSVPPVSPAHQLCLTVGSSLLPQEAISCQRRHPARERPIGSSYCPAGQPWWTQTRAGTPVAEGVPPSENLPLGHCSRDCLILRPRTGPRRG